MLLKSHTILINSLVSFNNIDSVLRNDTTRVIQPEVIYRSDTLGQTSSNTIAGSSSGIERKGSVAIGQSIFYTEDPPQDFGNSGNTSIPERINSRQRFV